MNDPEIKVTLKGVGPAHYFVRSLNDLCQWRRGGPGGVRCGQVATHPVHLKPGDTGARERASKAAADRKAA